VRGRCRRIGMSPSEELYNFLHFNSNLESDKVMDSDTTRTAQVEKAKILI
jgi:hypothetical protein